MLIEFLHSKASCMLFDYALNHFKKQATCGFVFVTCKSAKVSTPNILLLKDALISDKTDTWQKAIRSNMKL